MQLFKRKNRLDNPIWVSGDAKMEILPPQPNYDSVLEWLVGLSEDDFDKILRIAVIYRSADKSASETLGVEPEPTTYINPPSGIETNQPPVTDAQNLKKAKNFLEADDTELGNYLFDTHEKTKAAKKSTKVKK